MRGFSLIELIIVIAIMGVIFAISINSYQISQLKKNQDQIVFQIENSLEEQKINSQTGKNGQNYGVKFNQNNFILFSGTTYNPSDQNKIIGIAQQFEILETIINSDNIIYFSKILGESNQNATITVSHITNRIPQKQIVIKKSGSISVIE